MPAAATVLLSVCKINPSHCEAVLPANGKIQPRPPTASSGGGGEAAGSGAENGNEVGSLSEGEEGEEDPNDRRIDSEDGEPYTRVGSER